MTSRQVPKRQDARHDALPPLPPTAWAVLGLLSFPGERTGYELKKWADSSLRFFYWSPAISQIYAELRRLETLAYVTSRRSSPEEPRVRRSYAITGAGRAALARWADGAGGAEVPVLKHPLLLRVWLGHLADPARLRARVEDHIARTEGELAQVREARERTRGVADWAHPRVALRWAERQHLAELELAREMLADLADLPRTEAARETAERSDPHGAAEGAGPGGPPGDPCTFRQLPSHTPTDG
ncbi:PadR family transcriptional regulator [Streptomyces sp. NPDC004111]|uniref:PadR family transcriptional regulator n=1 Tax=Streptomyces sp. NPDC004111 TaxID=3364690 RepID=UPI00369E2C92